MEKFHWDYSTFSCIFRQNFSILEKFQQFLAENYSFLAKFQQKLQRNFNKISEKFQ